MPLCNTVLQQPSILPKSLTALGRTHLFSTRQLCSALRASSMVVPEGSGHGPTSEHVQRAWDLFRSWGSPQYWVAPMVDQVLLLPWHSSRFPANLPARLPVCAFTEQHSSLVLTGQDILLC